MRAVSLNRPITGTVATTAAEYAAGPRVDVTDVNFDELRMTRFVTRNRVVDSHPAATSVVHDAEPVNRVAGSCTCLWAVTAV
jgi:hypothetical protein